MLGIILRSVVLTRKFRISVMTIFLLLSVYTYIWNAVACWNVVCWNAYASVFLPVNIILCNMAHSVLIESNFLVIVVFIWAPKVLGSSHNSKLALWPIGHDLTCKIFLPEKMRNAPLAEWRRAFPWGFNFSIKGARGEESTQLVSFLCHQIFWSLFKDIGHCQRDDVTPYIYYFF